MMSGVAGTEAREEPLLLAVPELTAYLGQQFAGPDRLDEKTVATSLGGMFGDRRQRARSRRDNAHVSCLRPVAKFTGERQTVAVGQPEVQ